MTKKSEPATDAEKEQALGRIVRTPGRYTVRMISATIRDGVLVQTFEEVKTGERIKAAMHPLPKAEADADAAWLEGNDV